MSVLQLLRRRFAAVVVAALVVILLAVWAIGHTGDGSSPDGRSIVPTAAPTATAGDHLATVRYDDLPAQAHDTLTLIAKGGPYPYEDDGIVFQNREGLLPREQSGFYHEYTVETPGESDRGARRIVQADDGALYYTDDHYRSFKRIVQ